MTDTPTHAPLPWSAHPTGERMTEAYSQTWAVASGDNLIAGFFNDGIGGEEAAKAHALLVVRAVNSHSELVEALREVPDAVGALTNPSEFPNCLNIPEGRGLEILAALAKAEAGHG